MVGEASDCCCGRDILAIPYGGGGGGDDDCESL